MESKTTLLILFSILLLSCFIANSGAKNQIESQKRLKENDRIESLPGQPEIKFKQYGGYITVNRKAGRAFYYYFVEAQHSEKTLPLLLWLNGGPGCSSIGYGAMEELGPFRVHSDGKTLYQNNFAWNHAANVLFLESPAGVGFSYSNTTADVVTGGDKRTAFDNYVFLLNWFKRFPEYSKRVFYISGESYAGHYVPQLTNIILHHNKKARKIIINLKGIILGNAWINAETDTKGVYEYFGTHALIPDYVADHVLKYCDFSPYAKNQTDKCNEATNEAYKNIGNIDTFNIYAPLCANPSLTDEPKKISMSFDPCCDYYVHAYLNRPEVQKALHANITSIPYDWQLCNNVLFRKWQDGPATVLPLLKDIMASGLRVWLYSGDVDGNVPVTSTQQTIKQMKLPTEISWHPWYHSKEVGGYTLVYEGSLTFATVRGAGHDVPSYQPARALSLIRHFLAGEELPSSPEN
ncbi:serine carboxypeptidase-like 40 [Phtheirospermum japonicum]|uniref:Carboxypeptidase n=1 Tax=Phtheirospermum japonicum TaxID=374723 RepID=A0A830BD83_9LAMI|nr:serine carboxypeptidase-like 40 [Phtheirospermum japonicum]